MEIIRHADKCTITSEGNPTLVEAEVMEFDFQKKMTVVVSKSVKILMSWNGKYYEGRAAGLNFESHGPKISRTSTGR